MPKLINTSYDNQQFYEWDGLAENWVVPENTFDKDFPPQPQVVDTSLATHIIEDVFKLTLTNDSEDRGSYLPGYDVVNRAAYEMVQLSLTAELGNEGGKLYECYATNDGLVKFYEIGDTNNGIPSSSILYSFSQLSWKPKCDNVIVFGYDPPEKRLIRGTDSDEEVGYDLFTLSNNIDDSYLGEEFRDNDLGDYPKYWVTGDYLKMDACPDDNRKEGYIEYSNIALSNNKYLDESGVYDYYNFESIDGFVYKIKVPFFEQTSTRVEFRQRTLRYIELGGFGKLQTRDWKSNLVYKPSACYIGQDITDPSVGMQLPRSNEKKFVGVNAVYVIGYVLKQIECDEIPDFNNFTTSPGSGDFIVDLDTMLSEPFRLSDGEDYAVVKEPDSDYYRIVFSCNVSPTYLRKFGDTLGTAAVCKFRVACSSIYEFKSLTLPGTGGTIQVPSNLACARYGGLDPVTGLLRDGVTPVNDHDILTGAIFPTGEGNTGYVVKNIIVVYEWDNPCVAVFDQKSRINSAILEDIEMEVFPVIIKNPPQFVAHNGEALDPSEQLPDLDATTLEDLYDRPYQKVMSAMENADIRVSLPFLDQDGCNRISEQILSLQNQEVETVTYVCDPTANPVLGGVIDGKTINSIDYSYQDSSQYLINVQAGPVWQGMTSWDNSMYMNGTERIQLEGIVRFVDNTNMRCTVQLEQIGLMDCVNGQQQPLEAGDMVKVTIYNNPVRR